jgi:hypothetical protein
MAPLSHSRKLVYVARLRPRRKRREKNHKEHEQEESQEKEGEEHSAEAIRSEEKQAPFVGRSLIAENLATNY